MMMKATHRPAWAWQPHHARRLADDDFFADGDALCGPRTRPVILSAEDSWESEDRQTQAFRCQSADCKQIFSTVGQYEHHYNSAHRHPCMECRRGFPTNFLLEVHLTEWHDPLFDLQCHQQNMYRCLLESCSRRFSTHHARRDHMVRGHKYPANFRFEKPPSGKSHSDHQAQHPKVKHKPLSAVTIATDAMDTESAPASEAPSMPTASVKFPLSLASLARGCLKKSSDSSQNSDRPRAEVMDQDAPGVHAQGSGTSSRAAPDVLPSGQSSASVSDAHQMEVDTSATASCNKGSPRRFNYRATVPKTICFGAGSQRGFQGRRGGKRGGKHWHQAGAPDTDTAVHLENVDMQDLSQALDTS